MRVFVLVNRVSELEASQSTALLIEGLAAKGHSTWVGGVGDLGLTQMSNVAVRAYAVPEEVTPPTWRWLRKLRQSKPVRMSMESGDVLLLRLNPARDRHRAWAYDTALALASVAADRGVVVLNDPAGLRGAAHKLYLHRLPSQHIPKTMVARDVETVRAFVREMGRCVLKPVNGTRGRDVFSLAGLDAPNFNQIVDVLARDGYPLIQEYVAGAEKGDIRVLVVDGKLLELDGEAAAVARVPPRGDFRSNVHIGGKAQAVAISPEIRAAVADIGPQLLADGLFLVGLDFIGAKVVEVNAHSPGGLGDAEKFYDRAFTDAIVDAIASRATR